MNPLGSLWLTVFLVSFLVYSVYWGTTTFYDFRERDKGWFLNKLFSCYVCFGFWTAVVSVVLHFVLVALGVVGIVQGVLLGYALAQVAYRWHNPI